ncbi:MAG: polysaccharide pyruvyl transferase family protein [Ruminococcus sp.]|nr:polysaccharide pyruvyl transferase family protein [Ruminococcus sp.]
MNRIRKALAAVKTALMPKDDKWSYSGDADACSSAAAEQAERIAPHGSTIIIDPIIALKDDDTVSYEDKMRYAGANTGNMLFVSAVKEQLDYKDIIWFNGKKLYGFEKYGGACAVMPASNFISVGSDGMINAMKKLYEHTSCNITMAGLGAQSYPPYDTPKKLVALLGENKINFFRMAAERAVSLGVRGEFTAECLELMGIKNYRIIGCPTCFKYLDGVYKAPPAPTAERPVFTVTGKSRAESRLMELGLKSGAELLMQMSTEMPQILFGGEPDDAVYNYAFPEAGVTREQYIRYLKEHGHIFFDMDKWNAYLRESGFTFSFGSRFHGNMSALRCGIPSLWITHDSRTSELVETLNLPHISISGIDRIKDIKELTERCDYSGFVKGYGKLAREYVRYLDENGLKHRFTL